MGYVENAGKNMSQIIKIKFTKSIKRAGLVKSFRFYPEKPVEFKPGQFAKILFDKDNLSNKELNKYLSLSSSPDKGYLEFTKKLSQSEFSKRLNDLTFEDEIFIQAPLGNCIFRDDYKKIALLVGGIGITPAISIIEYIINKKLNTEIVLFYSNRTDQDIAFKEKLDAWKSASSNLEVVYTVTNCRPKDKSCIQGYIDEELLSDKLNDFKQRIWFIFGPPGMIVSMAKLCENIGCSGEKVKKEGFAGY